jgi:hypothetical protein
MDQYLPRRASDTLAPIQPAQRNSTPTISRAGFCGARLNYAVPYFKTQTGPGGKCNEKEKNGDEVLT